MTIFCNTQPHLLSQEKSQAGKTPDMALCGRWAAAGNGQYTFIKRLKMKKTEIKLATTLSTGWTNLGVTQQLLMLGFISMLLVYRGSSLINRFLVSASCSPKEILLGFEGWSRKTGWKRNDLDFVQ
jgi:hypothetical protein